MVVSKIILSIFVVLIVSECEAVQYGYAVRSASEHPYFVHIITTPQTGAVRQSGGTLLNDRWVITSLSAVNGAKKMMLYFGVYELDKIAFTKHLEVFPQNVVNYPTMVDDIALILLPERLQFNSSIQPIGLIDYELKDNLMGMVVGFLSNQNILRYGFLRTQNELECRKTYSTFDRYKQICTVGWTNPNQRPCGGNEGTGLIIDWPYRPRLAGIFSRTYYCSSNYPSLFVGLDKYLYWIRSEIANTPPLPSTTEGPYSTATAV